MSAELTCTCGEGGRSTGNRQEIIEKRIAPLFGITVTEAHSMLDLLTDVLDEILGKPEQDSDTDQTERLMAERSGRTVGWVENFLTAWEKINDDLDRVDWWTLPEVTRPGGTST